MQLVLLVSLVFLGCLPSSVHSASGKGAGGYVLMGVESDGTLKGLNEMATLAANARTLPVNKIWVSFFSPTMIYKPGSMTLEYTGLNADVSGDYGFAKLKQYIQQLQGGGVEVYLSMGGWNYNCWPYMYTRYSVGGYGTHTPNYWEVQKYCGGNLDNADESNMWCYTCEPPSEGTNLDSFSIFPEPSKSQTWQQAASFVSQGARGGAVQWNYDMIPGQQYTDSKTGTSTKVPGSNQWYQQGRDPYQDLVYLAKDLAAAGVDIDYEEFWHGDYFKVGTSSTGPWTLYQTVYKYSAIVKDVIINIQNIYPSCKLSTAAGAVGAWSGNWWGGNLKGLWLYANQYYPSIIQFMSSGSNAGGINVMTYDLSDNEQYYECPSSSCCTLDCQVNFYMGTYQQAGIPANVGYEVGTPAYPNPQEDPQNQLPLTTQELQKLSQGTQPNYAAGFFWEMYKPNQNGQASPTDVAQSICAVTDPFGGRCNGTIPPVNSPPPPPPPTWSPPPPPPTWSPPPPPPSGGTECCWYQGLTTSSDHLCMCFQGSCPNLNGYNLVLEQPTNSCQDQSCQQFCQ